MRFKATFDYKCADYVGTLIEKTFCDSAGAAGPSRGANNKRRNNNAVGGNIFGNNDNTPAVQQTIIVTFDLQRMIIVLSERTANDMWNVEMKTDTLFQAFGPRGQKLYHCESMQENTIHLSMPAAQFADALKKPSKEDEMQVVELKLTKDPDRGNSPALLVKKKTQTCGVVNTMIPCFVVQDIDRVPTIPDVDNDELVKVHFEAVKELNQSLSVYQKLLTKCDKIDFFVEKERSYQQLIVTAMTPPDSDVEVKSYFKFPVVNSENLESARAVLSLKRFVPNLKKLARVSEGYGLESILFAVCNRFVVVYVMLADNIGVLTCFNLGCADEMIGGAAGG
ncbi:unnamed protein product [Amoebophrya sp. A120]|nr:unnamed protein product [Amoebophrya sp. A120]|eukprot:GSA120T00018719001.1